MKRLGWGLDPSKVGIPEGMGLTRKQIIDTMRLTMKTSPEFLERFDSEWQKWLADSRYRFEGKKE